MKKAFTAVASFVRWVVAGIVSFIIALPTYFALQAAATI